RPWGGARPSAGKAPPGPRPGPTFTSASCSTGAGSTPKPTSRNNAQVSILSRWRLAAASVLLVLVSFTAGIWVDQTFPDVVPVIGGFPPQAGQGDQQTFEQAVRIIRADYYNPHVSSAALTHGSARAPVPSLHHPYSRYQNPHDDRNHQAPYAGRHH